MIMKLSMFRENIFILLTLCLEHRCKKMETPQEVETFVNGITEHFIPATKQRLEVYRIAQEGDPVCSQIMKYCHEG